MKPNTEMINTGARSQAPIHRERIVGKRRIALAMALLASLAASAPAETGGGTDEPYHVIFPVRTRVIGTDPKGSCNQYSVEVNGVKYNCGDGTLSGVNIVSFYRKPVLDAEKRPMLELYEAAYIHTDTGTGFQKVKEFLDQLLSPGAPSDLLVIVSSMGRDGGSPGQPLSIIAPELEAFGATKEFESIDYYEFTFSFIGIKKAMKGEGYQAGGDGTFKDNTNSWSLNGYLATDSSGNYAFFQPDYVQFDLKPANGEVKIGSQDYSAPGSNGIRVRVVDRANPEQMYSDNVYAVGNLPEDLGQKGEGELYFIVSVGQAFNSPGSEAQARDALKLARLGGTYELYANAGSGDTYCLVGAASPGGGLPPYRAAEGGSVEYVGQSPEDKEKAKGPLRGALGRGHRGNFFSPVASASQQTNFDFYSILAQKPMPFPNPAPGIPAEQKAFSYIAKKLCPPEEGCEADYNPRNGYWNTDIDIDAWKSTLESLDTDPYNPSVDCDAPSKPKTPYCVVRRQLLWEFTYVGNIRSFNGNISTLWIAKQANNIYSLLETGHTIQQELNANAKAPAPEIAGNLLKYVLLAGTYIPQVAPVFGVAYAAFSFGESLANNAAGDSVVSDTSATVAQLEEDAIKSFEAQQATIGTMFRFIYQDWGKIQALGSKLNNAGADWAWGDSTTSELLGRMDRATEASYYRSILTTQYALGQLDDLSHPDPADYHNGYEKDWPHPYCHETHPFKGFEPVQYVSSREIDNLNLWHVEVIGVIDQGGGRTCHTDDPAKSDKPYRSLNPTILKKIFGSGDSDLQVYQPDFYRHWQFPRVWCDKLGSNASSQYGFEYSTGCHWWDAGSSAAASESAVSTASPVNPRPEEFKSAVSAASSTNSSEIEAEAVTFPEEAASSLSYSWQVLGGNAEIFDGDTATPTIYFTSGPGSYVVRVTMADGAGNSWQRETTVRYEEQ
jgi:hypothetical protein